MSGILLVALALGLSNFAASIGIGLSGVSRSLRVRVAVVFGCFEATMPLIGLLAGHSLSEALGAGASWLGGGLLMATGVYTVVQARWGRPDQGPRSTTPAGLVLTGAALSTDNLVVGFALGAYRVPLAAAAVVIAMVSVGMSLLGLELGSRLGASVERWSAELGGAVLVVVGIAVVSGLL